MRTRLDGSGATVTATLSSAAPAQQSSVVLRNRKVVLVEFAVNAKNCCDHPIFVISFPAVSNEYEVVVPEHHLHHR